MQLIFKKLDGFNSYVVQSLNVVSLWIWSSKIRASKRGDLVYIQISVDYWILKRRPVMVIAQMHFLSEKFIK